MERLTPRIIVLALGAGALGGPDALRVLLDFAGQSPVVDIGICLFVIAMATTQLLGVVMLARFVRKARVQAGAGGGAAPRASVTDCLAKMTLMVSVGVAIVVTCCLVVVSGGLSSFRLVFDEFAGKSKSSVVAVLVVTGAAGYLTCTKSPLRVIRDAGNAEAAERLSLCVVAGGLLLIIPSIAHDALRLFPDFHNTFLGIAILTVIGITLFACFSRWRWACNAAAPVRATEAGRVGNLTRVRRLLVLAVLCFALACVLSVAPPYAYASPGRKSDGGKHACSA